MKKILIFYASYGGGHLSAAKSIKQYIDANYTDVETNIVDCIEYINKFLNQLTTGAYREMAKKAPKLWGKVYSNSQKGLLGTVSKDTNKLMARKLHKLIKEEQPDFIVSTHPFSSQMTSYLKRKNKINCKLVTILTDFAPHEQWLIGHEYTDLFFVSHDGMKQDLCNYGVNENKVFAFGIPMSNRFFEKFDRNSIFELFSLDKNKKVILFFAGGEFGLGKGQTLDVLHSLILNVPNYQIVAIAGKNEKMKEKFETLVDELNASDRVRVLPFTDKIPELMSISSLVVTKPGGLTTTESLACNLPLLIVNPIPGQEEENAEFLENKEVGIWLKKDSNIDEIILNLFSSEEKLNTMKENTKSLSKTNSTKNICNKIMEL